MKRKIFSLLLILSVLLVSCTPVDTELSPNYDATKKPASEIDQSGVETPAQDQADESLFRDFLSSTSGSMLWEGHDFMITSQGKMVNITTGQVLSLCFDPICEQEEHLRDTCPELAISKGTNFIISPQESKDTLVIYSDTYKFRTGATGVAYTPQLIRYDQATQTIEVLAEGVNLTGATWRFDPVENKIYYLAYRAESPTQLSMYSLDTTTKEIQYLMDPSETVFPCCIKDQVIYLYGMVSVYALDLKNLEVGCQVHYTVELPYRIKRISCGYIYVDLRERSYYSAPQEVLDRYEATFDPQDPQYFTFNEDVYRIPLDAPDAIPELILEDVSLASIRNGILYYLKWDPFPVRSYIVDKKGKMYRWDDPNAPPDGELKYVFSVDGGDGGIIDLSTMTEEVTFALDHYRLPPDAALYIEGTGMMCGELLDYGADTMIAAGSPGPKRYFFSLPLQQGDVVTDEDIIPITLN